MANPVAIYSPDPAALTPRGGTASAKIIQIDVYRSGQGARFGYAEPEVQDAQFEDVPFQGSERAQAAGANAAARGGRGRAADAGRRAGRFVHDDVADPNFEAGRRRAPASLSFAAQQIAQEQLAPGLHFENFTPVIAAYAIAAERPNIPPPGQALEIVA